MEKHQRHQLEVILRHMKKGPNFQVNKGMLEQEMLKLKPLNEDV